jgi:hypothetical protein
LAFEGGELHFGYGLGEEAGEGRDQVLFERAQVASVIRHSALSLKGMKDCVHALSAMAHHREMLGFLRRMELIGVAGVEPTAHKS